MNVMRSAAEADLIYVLLSTSEAEALRKDLRKGSPLRSLLKKVLSGR